MRTALLALPLAMLFLAGSCTGQSSMKDLDANAFERAVKASERVQLVDVRTPDEYAGGHLEGARNLDWNGGQFQQSMATLDKNEPVLLYCASGRRSAAALQELQKAGFKDVKHLQGGIGSWIQAGKPVAKK